MPSLEDTLFDLDQKLKKRGLPEMDRVTLAEVARHLKHPEVTQALQSGQLTTDSLVEEVMSAMRQTGQMDPSQSQLYNAAEGLTPQLQSGMSGLPPNASRIAGEPPASFRGFRGRNPFARLRRPGPFGQLAPPRETTPPPGLLQGPI